MTGGSWNQGSRLVDSLLFIVYKLSNDVEKAQQERTDLEKQMIHKSQESPEPGHSDHDGRIMESRLKVSR